MQGKTINGFELKKLLGVGGMAEVWFAENEIGMKAAVKILSEKLSHDDQMQERFLNEAKVMVKLDHPNIRKVQGYGSIDGRPVIIMEYLDGSDLKTRMKQGQHFTDEELKRWWNQMVDALNYTHAQDIVHRDIKPSNIFIDQKGNAKLLDFGIAKVADTTTGTLTGSTLGTRIYMSPEQVKDPKRVGTASDVYSLAVSFVHLLSGKAPYDSTTSSDYEIQVSIVTKPVDMSEVPAEWRDFLTPYLNKEADKRPILKCFEVVQTDVHETENNADDETEITEEPKNAERKTQIGPLFNDKSTIKTPHSGLDPLSPKHNDKPGPKKGLWIGIAAAVALLVFLLWPKKEPTPNDPDTEAYEACQTVADYRAYMRDYGRNALHYADVKAFVEQYEADSTAMAEEEAAYGQCTTIADCESYLQTYPQGCYVAEVRAKKAELEAEEEAEKKENAAYQKCTTIATCESYLKDYPQGRYVEEVRKKKTELEKETEKPVQPSTQQPSGSSLTITANGVSFVMKRVAGCTFQMGSNDSEAHSDEKPVHSVTVSTFFIGETEVTQALWKAVMGSNPSYWKGDNLPVEQVSWNDCQEFIRKLNGLTGRNFRLPTEAEWEFAARGGNQSEGYKYAGSNNIGDVAWYSDNSGSKTHAVKGRSPNELGLYDMSGNVWEWCQDWEGGYISGSQINPLGPSSGSFRVLRGGGWNNFARGCRVSRRYGASPGNEYYAHGFRLCLPNKSL